MRPVRASFSLSPNKNLTANRCLRLLLAIFFAFIFLSMASMNAFGQESKGKPLYDPKEQDRDHPGQRAQWNMRGREAPKGESAAALRLRAYQQKMAMRAQRAAAEAARAGAGLPPKTTPWVPLGPAPLASDATGNGSQDYNWVSGRATSMLIDPADATGNTVLLGGAYGGLWKSTNAGSQTGSPDNPGAVVWQSLIDDQPSLAVGAIALQPGNSNIILVGTGETNASGDSYYGMGILRSTDGGATWTQITSAASGQSFVGVGFSKIAFSTSNPNLVVASTAGDLGFDFGLEQDGNSTARGLYYSTDAGATWHRVTLADNAVPASVTGVVYNATQGAFYAAIRRHGIYSSTNGITFTRLATQPTAGLASANCPANSNSGNCQIYRAEFAVTPGRNEMYTWIVDVQGGEIDDGIWKTTNGGGAWTPLPDTGITNCGSGGGGDFGGCGVQQGVYNLELAAVPNSSGTDVYAGTINVYKCHVASGASSCSTIDPNVPNDWINLTHVYGCPTLGELAHVHPDQHGLAFMVVGSKAPGYFAHDGGISRTLDGYTGLNSGTCTTSNQFDSLAQTLGSMTEFVSFSVHPTSADIMLGGTQDNGSPKTATATTSTTWQNALSGDGGYNIINPNPGNGGDGIAGDEWFVSQPFSTIGYCEAGILCNDQNAFLEAAAGLNIDQGAFYTPFILDPQDTNEMLIGTCRVWRGDTFSAAFAMISNNFDTGTTALCNGGEVNQVAGLDAGGPKDANGFSNVVYATTWGYGPFAGIGGGEVWSTTNAVSATMNNVTGSINPNHYAIASVAIDTTDATGQTAYVGIMGFHTSHVWKTTNAGTSWTDWTGSGLPDAPVSSLLVDPAMGLVYAGTDVGVFSSPTTGTPAWTEVGPAASSGSGFLPSAPVTAIRIFNAGAEKVLRVSTYGRGIWEYPLATDYTNVISNTPQTIFPTQTATFNGTLTAQNGYNSPVNLTCTGTPPTTCTLNPTQETPTNTYTMMASGAVGDYNFNAHAVGTDPGTITHDAPVLLHIVDFGLTAPNPNTLTVIQGQTSNQSNFMVTASGSFSGAVTLSCPSGLPTGAACAFAPSATVNPTMANPVTVTLTVTAAMSTPVGSSTVTLSATTAGAPAAKTQTFMLQVNAPTPDFSIAVNATPNSTVANQPVMWSGTLTALNGYNKSVTLSCTAGAPGTCSISPNPLTPTAGGAAFTVTAASATTGTFNFTIKGTDGTLTHATSTETLTVATDVTWTSTGSGSVTVKAGQTAAGYAFSAVPVGAGTFSSGSTVTFACANLPALTSCVFNPTSITGGPGAGTTTVNLTITTTGPNPNGPVRQLRNRANSRSPWLPLSLPIAGIVMAGIAGRKLSKYSVIASLCLALALVGLLVACGSSSTPAISVTGVSGTPTSVFPNDMADGWPSQTAQFRATVNNDSQSKGVTWSVSGSAATSGTIDPNTGLYTAPTLGAGIPPTVTITATSVADPTKSSPVSETLNVPTALGMTTISVTATATGDQAPHSQSVQLTVQ